MKLCKSGVGVLSALLLATIAMVLVLRTVGDGPGTQGPAAPATATRTDPSEPAASPASKVVGGQFISEHYVLEAARQAAGEASRLKRLYLRCARETSDDRMDLDEALFCQGVADALRHRHVDGSRDPLLGLRRDPPGEAPAFAAAGGR